MKKNILILTLIAMATLCHAQELPSLPAERPGATCGTEILPLHKISWENGFGSESSGGTHTTTLTSTMLRYGIFHNVEVLVATDLVMINDGLSTEPTFDIAPPTLGTKIKVYEGSGLLPSVGLLAQLGLPRNGLVFTNNAELHPAHIAPSMYLLFDHEINERFGLGYNVGLEWDGGSATAQTFVSLSLGFSITDDIGTYVETYNYFHPTDGNNYMTGFGLTWMPTRRLQFDIECDLDLQGDSFAIGGGVAWMIN